MTGQDITELRGPTTQTRSFNKINKRVVYAACSCCRPMVAPGKVYGSTMVAFGDGPGDELEPSAMVTAAEPPVLTAATATLKPLASTAELASATIIRVRTTFMVSNPSGAPPVHESEITLCYVDADNAILTGIKGDGQRSAAPSPQVAASTARI